LFIEHVVPLLKKSPGLSPITLLDALDNIAPGKFGRCQPHMDS